MINFEGNTKFPKDFINDFMKNSQNKENLNCFLAEKLLEVHDQDKIIVITKGDGILTNKSILKSDPMISCCSAEEADQ